jgi:hypothetical protein
MTPNEASKFALERWKMRVKPDTIYRHVKAGSTAPRQVGRPTFLDPEDEEKFVKFTVALRSVNHVTTPKVMREYLSAAMKDTPYEILKPDGVQKGLFRGILKRNSSELRMGSQKKLEIDRAHNTTSGNLLRGYENYKNELLKAKFAVENPEYDPDYKYDPKDPENIKLQVQCAPTCLHPEHASRV